MPIDERALYSKLGRRLRERRNELEVTQDSLAKKTGVVRTSIANIEAARQKAPLHVLYQLFDALGLDLRKELPSAQEIKSAESGVTVKGIQQPVPAKTAEIVLKLQRELE